MNGNNAACRVFDELRGVIRKCNEGIGGLDHGQFSSRWSIAKVWHPLKLATTGQVAGALPPPATFAR